MILDYRLRVRKSQNELAEELGIEWGTISRYENGKNQPSRKNYQFLPKNIGIPVNKYNVILSVQDYTIYKQIRQVERFLFRDEFILAEQLFFKIESVLSKEKAENRQYYLRTRAVLDFLQGRIDQEEELYLLEKAIRYTFPTYNVKNENFLKNHIPVRYEIILLNHISACYENLGKRKTAIMILKSILESYDKSKIRKEYHLADFSLIMANYSDYLGRQNEYLVALEAIDKILRMNLEFRKGNMIPYLIYAKGWNLLQIEGSNE